jgi:hypothetical protein
MKMKEKEKMMMLKMKMVKEVNSDTYRDRKTHYVLINSSRTISGLKLKTRIDISLLSKSNRTFLSDWTDWLLV